MEPYNEPYSHFQKNQQPVNNSTNGSSYNGVSNTRRKRVPWYGLEIVRVAKSGPDNQFHNERLINFLKTSTAADRREIVSIEHTWMSSMLRQMYKYTRTNLDSIFGLAENIKGLESNELLDWFYCERRSGKSR